VKYTLRRGRTYKAQLVLRGLTKMASNAQAQAAFQKFGFVDVEVTGVGRNRIARGRWTKRSTTLELPKEVVQIIEMK